MLDGYQIFDADAHTMMSPKMWSDLPEDFAARRPRAVRISDESGFGYWNTGWYVEGRLEPHPFGPGAQSANTPAMVLDEFKPAPGKPRAAIGSNEFLVPLTSLDLSDPAARLKNLEQMAVDIQLLFPSTLYAHMVADPGFEAALYRSYNRYVGRQCQAAPKRLNGPGCCRCAKKGKRSAALDEMQKLGASAAVVFGTVGERLLSDPSFKPIWDVFAQHAVAALRAHGHELSAVSRSLPVDSGCQYDRQGVAGAARFRRHRRQQDARPVCQFKGGFPRVRRRMDLLHVRQNGALPQSQSPAHAHHVLLCRKRKSRIMRSPAEFLSRRNPTTRCWPRRSLSSVKIKSFFLPTFPTARDGKTPPAVFSSAAI